MWKWESAKKNKNNNNKKTKKRKGRENSSIVYEGIRAILNLFIFFFYKKISHPQKAQKV